MTIQNEVLHIMRDGKARTFNEICILSHCTVGQVEGAKTSLVKKGLLKKAGTVQVESYKRTLWVRTDVKWYRKLFT
jgi:hypothetical protein